MTTATSPEIAWPLVGTARADALADRLLQGARALAARAATLTEAQWRTPVPDGRTIGVVVHHVASMYPIEIELAQKLAGGETITGLTWPDVHALNARHAAEHAAVTPAEALDLLERNSTVAAAAIRMLSDAALDRAAGISLDGDAPLTCQYMLEAHAVRHAFHHLAAIEAALTS